MDFAQIFETWKAMMAAGEDLPWWQDFLCKILTSIFIEAGRWRNTFRAWESLWLPRLWLCSWA